jgi:hypothetical protein
MAQPLEALSNDLLLAEIEKMAKQTKIAASQGLISSRDEQQRFSDAMKIANEKGLKLQADGRILKVSSESVSLDGFRHNLGGTHTR